VIGSKRKARQKEAGFNLNFSSGLWALFLSSTILCSPDLNRRRFRDREQPSIENIFAALEHSSVAQFYHILMCAEGGI
jgi:hypothetical protein